MGLAFLEVDTLGVDEMSVAVVFGEDLLSLLVLALGVIRRV